MSESIRPHNTDAKGMLHFYRSGSSVSLQRHVPDITEMLPARDPRLLGSRGPAYPALHIDQCKVLAEENIQRRSIHKKMVEVNPSIFRRKAANESLFEQLHERNKVNDLLSGMHGLKDLKDLNKRNVHRINTSRRAEEAKREKMELDEHLYNQMPPPEDFVRPDDTSSPRSTGYEHGHIRSLLKVDTFGPVSSSVASLERSIGLLPPHSPNIDRYKSDGSNISKFLGSKSSSRMNSRRSRGLLSSSSSEITENNSFATMSGLFHETSYVRPDDDSLSSLGSTRKQLGDPPKSGTLGYYGKSFSVEERALVDPILKRKIWFKHFKEKQKLKEEMEKKNQRVRNTKMRQQRIAIDEGKATEEFEKHLKLSKFKTTRRGVGRLKKDVV